MKILPVCIADLPAHILLDDTALFNRLEDFFSTYLTNDEPLFKIILKDSGQNMDKKPRDTYPVILQQDKNGLTIVERRSKKRYFVLGSMTPQNKTCTIDLNDHLHFSSLISAIRTCFHFYLEQNNGFFLHAACGAVNGKAYVFTGKSDSGKTTALNNFNPEQIIAEDALALRVQRNRLSVFAIPFRSDKNARAKAHALFFPKKAAEPARLEKQNPASTAAEVIANAMYAAPHDAQLLETVIQTITQFCRVIPGFNLYFSKNCNLQKALI